MYSIIIVDYNSIPVTIQYISECIRKIKEQEECHFIVVDNYPNSNIEEILSQFKDIKLNSKIIWKEINVLKYYYQNHSIHFIAVNENVGYAKGNNIGIKYAQEIIKDNYVLISNNDISFPNTISLHEMKSILEDREDIAIVGPKIVGKDGRPQSPYKEVGCWSLLFELFARLFIRIFIPIKNPNKALDSNLHSRECYWVSGCFFLADSNRLEAAGGFDENTFLYAEEMILAERLLKQGYKNYFYKDIEVTHWGSSTVSKHFKNLEIENVLFSSYVYYFKKYKETPDFIIWLAKLEWKLIQILYHFGRKIKMKIGKTS